MLKEKSFKKILQVVFFISLFAPFIVDRRLFFPYVTGSVLFFRAIVELLFVLWIIFVMLYPKYRPKFNLLFCAISIYLLALVASVVFGNTPYVSFWGDAERMMGLFGLLHFFALFLVGVSIFRDKNDLRNLLKIFVISSLVVALHAILQRLGLTSIKPSEVRVVATVGNAGVLAAYMIFGFFLSLYLALTEDIKWQKTACGISSAVFLLVIFLTGTRGAYLGVGIGILFAAWFIIKNFRQKKLRKIIALSVAAILLIYLALFACQNCGFVKNSAYLYRLTHFSLNDATLQMRLMAWEWGLKGFLDKPIVGYGLENYTEPFNKYFEARYYDLSPSMPYFDRAHNIVIELLSTTGVVGFVSYLLLLGVIVYYLFKKYKRDNDNIYFGIFAGLLVAYFVQNLFIFDMLPALIGFMILLIAINNSYSSDESFANGSRVKLYFIVPIAIILASGLLYSYKYLIIDSYKA
jgi:O-antigen ligase